MDNDLLNIETDARITDGLTPNQVRCDIFKSSGKWYDTIELDFTEVPTDKNTIMQEACKLALENTQYKSNSEGSMFAVILAPYHYNSHPILIHVK